MIALISFLFSTQASAETVIRTEGGVVNWHLNHASPFTAPVRSVGFTFGKSFINTILESRLNVDIWNGAAYDQQTGNIAVNHYFQGDSYAQGVTVGMRRHLKQSDNSTLSLRVHAGATRIPVLMDEKSYDTLVVGQSWGLSASPNHRKLYIGGLVGLGYDVYRFSDNLALGFNGDVEYLNGWDLGSRVSISLSSKL
jgi:hypothetical protein